MTEKLLDDTFDTKNSRRFDGTPSWEIPLVPYGRARTEEAVRAVDFFESMDAADANRTKEEEKLEQTRQVAMNKEWNELLEPIRSEIVSTYGFEIESLLRLAGAATFKTRMGADYRYYEKSFEQHYPHPNSQPLYMWVAAGEQRLVTDKHMVMDVQPGFVSGEKAAYTIIASVNKSAPTTRNAEMFEVDGELTGEHKLYVSVGLENETVGPFRKDYKEYVHTFWVGDPNWRDVLLSGVRYFYRNREVQGLVVKSSNTRYADTIPGPTPDQLH